MNCNTVHKLLSEYLDGKLTAKQNEEVRLHLDECSKCNNLYLQVQKTVEQLKLTSEIPDQPFYYTRLKQRMEHNAGRNYVRELISNFKKVFQPVIYAATIIMAVYIGILIGANSSKIEQYSSVDSNSEKYIEDFAEYSYINDLEIEPIETLFLSDTLNKN